MLAWDMRELSDCWPLLLFFFSPSTQHVLISLLETMSLLCVTQCSMNLLCDTRLQSADSGASCITAHPGHTVSTQELLGGSGTQQLQLASLASLHMKCVWRCHPSEGQGWQQPGSSAVTLEAAQPNSHGNIIFICRSHRVVIKGCMLLPGEMSPNAAPL